MDFSANMTSVDKTLTQMQVDTFNKGIAVNGRTANQELGKDDFLKILLTQLTHQDPTKPMEDTAFIAQMAQFSTLEQMTNMSSGFTKLTSLLGDSEAITTLGKRVDISVGDTLISGVVEAATRGENPQVTVNGTLYNWKDIQTVYN